MDGLVAELLRLESAKHKALIEIDAPAYDDHVQSQLHLLSCSGHSGDQAASLECLLSLSQLITLNTRLLHNLVSTSPLFAFNKNGYTARGRVAMPAMSQRVSIEA
jgi:hypothetical protein